MTINLNGYGARLRRWYRLVSPVWTLIQGYVWMPPGSPSYRVCRELRADVLASAT